MYIFKTIGEVLQKIVINIKTQLPKDGLMLVAAWRHPLATAMQCVCEAVYDTGLVYIHTATPNLGGKCVGCGEGVRGLQRKTRLFTLIPGSITE